MMSRLLMYFCLVHISVVWSRTIHRPANLNGKLALSRHRRQDDNNYYNNYYQQYQQQQEEQRQQYEQEMQNQYEQQNQQYEQEQQQQQYEQEQQQYEQEMQNQYDQQNQQYDQQNQQYEQDQQQQQYEQEMQNQQQQYEQQMNDQQQDDRGADDGRQKRSLPVHHSAYPLPNHALKQSTSNQQLVSQPVVHVPVAVYDVNYSLCKYLLEVIISLLREEDEQNGQPQAVPINDAAYTIVPDDDTANLQVNNDNEIGNQEAYDDESDMNDIS